MNWQTVLIVIQLIFLEGILSIDNAAVLGAMVSPLSDKETIQWPKSLLWLGRLLNPLLGPKRTAALRIGLLGAYVGRGTMLFLATLIIHNPWLKALGAIYLIRLASNNLGIAEENEEDPHVHPLENNSFVMIVVTVEITDLIFSIDNVIAAVALSDQFWVVMLGVAIGILLMRFAAGLFSYAVEAQPVLKTSAYVLVLLIGLELVMDEFFGWVFADWMRFAISVSVILLSLAYAHSRVLQFFRPVLVWGGQGLANLNELIDWALVPLFALFSFLSRLILRLFKKAPAINTLADQGDEIPDHIH